MSYSDYFDELELWRSLHRHGLVEKSIHELGSPDLNTLRHVIEDLFQSAGFVSKQEAQETRLLSLREEIDAAEHDLTFATNELNVEFGKLAAIQKKIEDENLWLAKLGFPVADRAFAEAEQALKTG